MDIQRGVRAGSVRLLAVMVAMVAALISFPAPAWAQPAPNLPEVCATFREPVVVRLEHDAPLRMVAAAIWEGMDAAQAASYLNGGCATPAPRALNALPGRHGTGGMGLRATVETRTSLFQISAVEGVNFLAASSVVCDPRNTHVFEAHYRLVREVPADAGTPAETDASAPAEDAGFVREEERGDLTIDCARVQANPEVPRRWFRERVPHGASIYIGARDGRDLVLPRGGIARPTESACSALGALATDPSSEPAISTLRTALRDPEPVEASVRAAAVDRLGEIASELARRLSDKPSPSIRETPAPEDSTLRAEVRRLRRENRDLRGENRGLRGSIETLRSLPTWLGIIVAILVFALIFGGHYALAANDKLAKRVRRLIDEGKTLAAKSRAEGQLAGRKSVFLEVATQDKATFDESLPTLVSLANARVFIERVQKHYDTRVLPPLRARLKKLEAIESGNIVGAPNVQAEADRQTIQALNEELEHVNAAAAASERWVATLVNNVRGFGYFLAKRLASDHPSVTDLTAETTEPVTIIQTAVNVIHDMCRALKEAEFIGEHTVEAMNALDQLTGRFDTVIRERCSLMGEIIAEGEADNHSSTGLPGMIERVKHRAEIIITMLKESAPPPIGLVPREGPLMPLVASGRALMRLRGGPPPRAFARPESPKDPTSDGSQEP